MDDCTRILVQVLADGDAVWLPLRTWNRPAPANRYFARRDFAKSGVAWQSGGATEADRKAMQRALEGLVKRKLVKSSRPRRVKTLGIKLSDAADVQARATCGLPGLLSAWLAIGKLASCSKRPPELVTDLYIDELHLIGDRPPADCPGEAVLVENMLLPALVRGYVEALANRHGRVYYLISPAGWEWIERGERPADDLAGRADREARAWYDERIKDALYRLDTAPPLDPREIGMLPLPVALGELPLSRKVMS